MNEEQFKDIAAYGSVCIDSSEFLKGNFIPNMWAKRFADNLKKDIRYLKIIKKLKAKEEIKKQPFFKGK